MASVADGLSILIKIGEALWKLKEEKENLEKTLDFRSVDISRKIDTVQSFERRLNESTFAKLDVKDQVLWKKKGKDMEKAVEDMCQLMEKLNDSMCKRCLCAKSYLGKLDEHMENFQSVWDDFEKFLNNMLRIEDHNINRSNNELHKEATGYLRVIAKNTAGKVT